MWRVGSFIYPLQLCRCPDLSDFQQKISSILSHNEKLLKEKEALSEELNICVDKVIKIRLYHHHMVCTVMNISVMPVAYGPTVLT